MINKKELNKRLLSIISDVKNTKTIKAFPYLLETLKNTEFELENNEFKITIVGEFSSGKSTFLNGITGIDKFDSGDVDWNGIKISGIKRNVASSFLDFLIKCY